MKLFYQLSESEQDEVIKYCTDLIIQDIIEDGIKLEPMTEQDHELKDKLDAAMDHINSFSTIEEKTSYLLSDDTISRAIYDIAVEMGKSAYFHEENEMIIHISDLRQEETSDDDDDEEEEFDLINTKKKISELN